MAGDNPKKPRKPQRENEVRIVRKKRAARPTGKATSLGKVAVQKHRAKPERPSLFVFTMIVLYKNLYILGIDILRQKNRIVRRLKRLWYRSRVLLGQWIRLLGGFLRRVLVNLTRRMKAPFTRIGTTYKEELPAIQSARRRGRVPWASYFSVAEAVGRMVLKVVFTIFNYVAPVVAAVILIGIIQTEVDQTFGLKLIYNGIEMGYIQNETDFDAAMEVVQERLIDDSAVSSQKYTIGDTLMVLEKVDTEDFLETDDLADQIIMASGDEIESAFGLYINSRFYGAVTDKDVILDEMDRIKNSYTQGRKDVRAEFVKSIRLTEGLYPAASVVEPEAILNVTRGFENVDEFYVVEDGDTPSGIADKLGIPLADLREMNPELDDLMYAGEEIYTAVARPFLSVQTIFTTVYDETVPYETEEVENALYASSYRQVTRDGVNGRRRVTAEVTMLNGSEIDRTIIGEPVITLEPVNERVVVGVNVVAEPDRGSGSGGGGNTDRTPSAARGGFIWPTVSGRATTYPNHTGNGVDIAPGGGGHPIYASASGTVVLSKWGYTGYGNYVMIQHDSGFVTLYAHMSDLYVSVGDQVGQGQVIGAMGRTGWATGNHLHFEIRQNGRYLWPPDYIGYVG